MNTFKNILKIAILFLGYESVLFAQETVVKGKVHNWPTDTVYIASLPFHSPYSRFIDYRIISKDSIFDFKFLETKEPFVFFISPEKESINAQIKTLLYDNLTDQHYFGQCIKVYTFGVTTYLIEPNTLIDIELTFNSWIEELSKETAEQYRKYGMNVPDDNKVRNVGKTEILFSNPDKYSCEYYQKSFDLDDKCDKALERSKKIETAIKKLKATEKKLLSDLEQEKGKIRPFLYEYIKAEIEFGARKEFLKYLRFNHEKYLSTIFKQQIPKEIIEIVEFDKEKIDYSTLINEEYNEYLENYLNFKLSIEKKEYIVYQSFNKEKFEFAIKELPQKSIYYYLANNLLHSENLNGNKELTKRLISEYPEGELNIKLNEKYQ